MKKPPTTKNYDGHERKVGFEIEYSGLPLKNAAHIVRDLFSGKIEEVTSATYKVIDTKLGDFILELDAISLQKVAESTKKTEDKVEESLLDDISLHIGKAIGSAGEKIVPFEIVSPPISLSDLPKLEELRKRLLEAGAKDTKENLYTAFGLHINPEVSSLDADYIIRHIQSFLLLAPWLKQLHHIDLTRKVTSFIDLFPKSYLQLVLDKKYTPSTEQLIRDYHEHNPTRNYALDMLPLFVHIDEPLVRKLYGKKEKINKRPTFHYRLPNCELANVDWSFNTEWKRWLKVEELANDTDLLHTIIKQWQAHQERWFAFESEWVEEIKQLMKRQK